jgi:hypothetical protein
MTHWHLPLASSTIYTNYYIFAQQGLVQPASQGFFSPIAQGFFSFIAHLLLQQHPVKKPAITTITTIIDT